MTLLRAAGARAHCIFLDKYQETFKRHLAWTQPLQRPVALSVRSAIVPVSKCFLLCVLMFWYETVSHDDSFSSVIFRNCIAKAKFRRCQETGYPPQLSTWRSLTAPFSKFCLCCYHTVLQQHVKMWFSSQSPNKYIRALFSFQKHLGGLLTNVPFKTQSGWLLLWLCIKYLSQIASRKL